MKCKNCKRKLPNKQFTRKQGCLWCNPIIKKENNLNFNNIELKKDGKIIYSFYPSNIKDIIIKDKYILIKEKEKTTTIYLKDYLYIEWSYFLDKLKYVFNLDL